MCFIAIKRSLVSGAARLGLEHIYVCTYITSNYSCSYYIPYIGNHPHERKYSQFLWILGTLQMFSCY